MMTATQVFGKRCGQFAARRAKKLRAEKSVPTVASPAVPCSYADRNREATEVLATLKRRIKEAMRKHAAILRDKRGLRKCSKQLSLWIKQLGALGCLGVSEIDEYYRVRNMAITANQVVDCALARQESRGSHFRRDDKKFKFGKPYQIN